MPKQQALEQLVKERKAVWMALSEFYLDTELEDYEIAKITTVFAKSPYTLEEIRQIDRFEIWPFLQDNMWVWSGFDENWIYEQAALHINLNDTRRGWFLPNLLYKLHARRYWKMVHAFYDDNKI